jgi:Zn-dependent peptidase ImmA (M78 family)
VVGENRISVPAWKQGEDAALALRLRLNYGLGPVNVWDAIRKLGVGLALEDFGPTGGDGRYLNKNGKALIVINTAQRVARQRFTAAHELGHHEMHRYSQADLVIVDDDVFAAASDPLEVAANAFAGNFTAPADGLAQALGQKRNRDVRAEDVVAIMGEFGLSYQATVYRLHNSGLITSPCRDHLLQEAQGTIERLLADMGVDDNRVLPNKVVFPLPADYVEQVATLWRRRHISDLRFAEMLRLDPEQATEFRARRSITRPELPDHDGEAVSKLLGELS